LSGLRPGGAACGLDERPSALRSSPAAFWAKKLNAEKKFQAKRSFQRSAPQVKRSSSEALLK